MEEKAYRIYLCGNLHCLANGESAILRALEQAIWEYDLAATVEMRVSGCQSLCDIGPNIKIWPGPYQYPRVTPTNARRIVIEHLRDGVPVAELLIDFR